MKKFDKNIATLVNDMQFLGRHNDNRFTEETNPQITEYLTEYRPIIEEAIDAVMEMSNDDRSKLESEYVLNIQGRSLHFFESTKDRLNNMANNIFQSLRHHYDFEQLGRALEYALYGSIQSKSDVDIGSIQRIFPRNQQKEVSFEKTDRGYNAKIKIEGGMKDENVAAFYDLPITPEMQIQCLVTVKYPLKTEHSIPSPKEPFESHFFIPNESYQEFQTILRKAEYKVK